jgi:hypothetical protein
VAVAAREGDVDNGASDIIAADQRERLRTTGGGNQARTPGEQRRVKMKRNEGLVFDDQDGLAEQRQVIARNALTDCREQERWHEHHRSEPLGLTFAPVS